MSETQGSGSAGPTVMIRKARRSDAAELEPIIQHFAARNAVLPRTTASIVCAIRDFWVAEVDGRVAGCCALTVIDEDLVEVRTLVVDEAIQGLGLGRKLVEACIAEAESLGFSTVFALTRVVGFFERMGFTPVPMSSLPQKVWLDCVHCPSFPNCDEVAMARPLHSAGR